MIIALASDSENAAEKVERVFCLHNDEVHSFDQVIEAVERHLMISRRRAVKAAHLVDAWVLYDVANDPVN
jgi:hypothetical protein